MNVTSLDRLAFGLSQADGTYAVLLGSGISRAAGIPTGWEIAVDLISQIAKLRGEDTGGDYVTWYQSRFGRPVNYSDLVESLASTQAERSRLLSRYVEPDAEDIREGRKRPTLAHKDIATLVKHGCIRLIITTNIDRLMETALAAEQIHPVIISSPDDLAGMVPLSHSSGECLVIKLHGDYKDIRSLNTASELERYPESIDRLLDQIITEFGMIVCGWSAQWDIALCDAVKRSNVGAYSWFWAEHGLTNKAAEDLIAHQGAERIPIEDADSFFHELLGKVERLWGIDPQEPPPIEQGVAVLQRYLDQHLGLRSSDMQGGLSAVVSQLFALSSPAISEPQGKENTSQLAKQIDFARQLIEKGLVAQAKKELEQLWAASSESPEDLQARIATNLAACAMADEDVDSAVSWWEEAYRLQPDNPNVVANAALAAHQASDTERALELARRSRELNPVNSPGTSVIMIEMWRGDKHEALDEFLITEDWVTHHAQCALVLANIRLLQSRFDEAVAICRGRVAEDDQDALARLALSQSLMLLAQANRHSTTYTEQELAQIEEVVSNTTKAIELLRPTELKINRHAALVLRGCARAILGFKSEAMADLDEVLRERPNSSEAAFYKALLHLNDDQPAEAAIWFNLIEDTSHIPDPVAPFAHALLLSGNPAAAVSKLRGSFNPKFPQWEDVHRAELLFKAESSADEDSTVVPALETTLKQTPTDPRLLVLDAVVRSARGDQHGAEKALLIALEHVEVESRPEVLMRLGFFYQDCHKFAEAADHFSKAIDGNPLHPLAVSLLVCLNNSKRLRQALDWSRTLQRPGRDTPRIVGDIELSILQLVGDVPAAVEKCERICERPDATTVDRVNLASAQIRLSDFDAARRTVLEIDRSELLNTPRSVLQLAQIKRLLGIEGYLDDAYTARRIAIDDAEVHLGYFSTILGQEHELGEPQSVGPGCAVLLRSESGEHWWSIVDHGEQPVGTRELALEAELSTALANRQVGETVVLRQGLEDLQYEVVAVQSKFVRAFQETADDFSTRFPNNMKLFRVAVDVEDPSKFLQTVDEREKFVSNFEQLYREGVIPLVTFAHHIGQFPLEAWRAGTQHGLTRISFGLGSDQETDQATILLREIDSIILDTVALFTVHELGIIDPLLDRFARVSLPQLVFDDLQNMAFNLKLMRQASGFIGKTENGRYAISDMPEDAQQRWHAEVEAIRDFASSLELVPSYGLLDTPDVEQMLSMFTPAGAGSVWVEDPDSSGRLLLVSDDLALSKVASAFGTNAVNTQALLFELHQSGRLDNAHYSRLVERLTEMNYWFVRVGAEDIISRFEAHGYVTTDGTRAMIRTLRGPDCLEDSAVSVATDLVVGLSSRTVPGQLELILALVLSTLQQGRETSLVLSKFQEALKNDHRLPPLTRQRLLTSIISYQIGGMTRAGHGLVVLRP